MKRLFCALSISLFCILTFPANVHAQQTPIAFNDKLVSITDSLYVRGQQWGTAFNESVKTKDFTTLAPLRLQLERFVNQKLKEVKAMEDVKNSRALREAMISFLEYEKSMIAKAFKPYESLGKNPYQEKIKEQYEQMKVYSANEGEELAKVNKAQEAYAASNGFKIEAAQAADQGDE